MKKMLLLLLLIPGIAFAATMEEVENHFQNGLKYSQEGMIDEALNEFYKVVSSDRSGLPEDYYLQTYSEAFFDIGMLYSKKDDIEKGVENFKKALSILPDHKRALYYLSFNLITLGEISEAKLYYERVKLLGFIGDAPQAGDMVGEYFAKIKKEEFSIQYQPFLDPGKTVTVTIKGSPCGDEELIRDTITAIEKQSKIVGYDILILTPILVERIRQKENNTIIIEKWTIGGMEYSKGFWIKYDFTPPQGYPYKTMILISETEEFLLTER